MTKYFALLLLLFTGAAQAITVDFDLATSTGYESVASPNITAVLSEGNATTVTVTVEISGTATRDVDYITTVPIVFAPDETRTSATLAIIDDSLYEDNETIILTMTAVTSVTLGTVLEHTYTIVDNDVAPPNKSSATTAGKVRLAPPIEEGKYTLYAVHWETMDTGTVTFSTGEIKGKIVQVVTVPTGSPTDDYDVAIKQYGISLIGTTLDNRDTTNAEVVQYAGTNIPILVGQVSIGVTNAGTTKSGSIYIYTER